jgi:hypothetical protein
MDFGTVMFFVGMSIAAFLVWLCVWAGEFK